VTDWRPKFRADVHAHLVGPGRAVLDTWSGIELLEGRLAMALPYLLKGEPLDKIIEHVGPSYTLDVLHELEQLGERGLLAETGENGDEPALVITTDYLDPQLERVNAEALAAARPWMLVRPRGSVVWVGPVFVPGRGPCWGCMAARLRAVRAAWQLPERRPNDDAPVAQIGLDLAALEAARWKRQPHGRARLLTFDTRSFARQWHVILRRSDCPACGDPSARRPFAPLILQSRESGFTPEETYERHEHLVSPLTGVVHHLEGAPGGAGSLHVCVARHNYVLGRETIPQRSFGKGVTAAQARTAALCEALERYCGIFRGDEPLLRASFRDLGEDAVHPNACLGISDRQYRERETWNSRMPRVLRIPEPFDESAETDWAPAWSLTQERKRHVAAALCYYGIGDGADSNGNAAGGFVEEAVLGGMLELIERDAVGIWWYGRVQRPAMALETPYVQAMRREYAARGRRLWLLDLTTDLGIPVCAAISIATQPESLHLGFGAHLDPAAAVTRAITEANQLLAVPTKRLYSSELPDWAFLEPRGLSEPSTMLMPSDDPKRDVLACVDVLRRRGLEVIVLDQTRGDVGLPVVKVIVPGLRHFRPRFAPGRLYDVPLQLGWIEHPLREENLNPSHLLG
jgi:bacteriocin biosynthesis cyclodehydratase domain-containing protein